MHGFGLVIIVFSKTNEREKEEKMYSNKFEMEMISFVKPHTKMQLNCKQILKKYQDAETFHATERAYKSKSRVARVRFPLIFHAFHSVSWPSPSTESHIYFISQAACSPVYFQGETITFWVLKWHQCSLQCSGRVVKTEIQFLSVLFMGSFQYFWFYSKFNSIQFNLIQKCNELAFESWVNFYSLASY